MGSEMCIRDSPRTPHAAAVVPSGPAECESDTDVLLCNLVGQGGEENFFFSIVGV